VRDTDTIEDAAALLTKHAITAAPVLDQTGTVVGIVSDADLLWRRVPGYPTEHAERAAAQAPPRPKVVAEVMSPHPLTTTPPTDLADIAKDMIHHDVRSIPVLDHRGELVGIVSRRDIVRSVIRTDEALAQEIQHQPRRLRRRRAPMACQRVRRRRHHRWSVR
jgi:CBS domain-containing protein